MRTSIGGHKVPIPFKAYEGFASNSHGRFDFTIAQKSYRDKLGQLYQAELLKSKDPSSKSQAQPTSTARQAQAGIQDIDKLGYRSNLSTQFRSTSNAQFNVIQKGFQQ